jgi:enterochelin esterase family protein
VTASYPLVVLFNGWELVEIGRIGAVFDAAVHSGLLPPFVAVLPDPAEHRTGDLLFSADHHTFVTGELLGWARSTFKVGDRAVVGGASLGGLAALYTAVTSPGTFTGAVSLIGAVGANRDGEQDWLAQRFTQTPLDALRVYLAAGLLDDDTFPGGHDWLWLPEKFVHGIAHVLK